MSQAARQTLFRNKMNNFYKHEAEGELIRLGADDQLSSWAKFKETY